VQVDPIKPTLTAPGTKRLKLKYYKLLSNFPFKFNLRLYNTELKSEPVLCYLLAGACGELVGRGLHSSTFQLNLSRC
jgi:hypothetical protein